MIKPEHIDDILIYNGFVDFRKSIDGLSSLVQDELNENPFSKTLFLFFSRNRRKVKILYWDQSGFALWYKRLEKNKFNLPKSKDLKTLIITDTQLKMLLIGYDIWKMKPHETLCYEQVC